MTPKMLRRGHRSRGAALVETALILPILMTVVLGFFDFGSWELQSTQASSASRDGARVAILRYKQADVAGSADNKAIVDVVKRRLAGQAYSSLKTFSFVGGATVTSAQGEIQLPGANDPRLIKLVQ